MKGKMRGKRVILLYKPYGVLCQFTPLAGHRTLADFGLPKGVYPAGRLDRDSEGLVLLTDDGELQHRWTDPRFGHPRTYLVQEERVPERESLSQLAGGVVLKDGRTRPCHARLLSREPGLPPRDPPIRYRKTVPTAWLELTLTEGRNRQVRRMTAAVGHPTLRLIRTRIGIFGQKDLKPGQWRYLTPRERKAVAFKHG